MLDQFDFLLLIYISRIVKYIQYLALLTPELIYFPFKENFKDFYCLFY